MEEITKAVVEIFSSSTTGLVVKGFFSILVIIAGFYYKAYLAKRAKVKSEKISREHDIEIVSENIDLEEEISQSDQEISDLMDD